MSEYVNGNAFGAAQVSRARDAVLAVLDRGQLFRYPDDGGPSACTAFEQAAAAWLGVPHATSVSSGTAGLRIALSAVGVRPGDRVLVPAFTFIATAAAVVAIGAIPEPFDVGPDLTLDVEDLRARLHSRIRCVIAVHVQGHAVDVERAAAVLSSAGVPLVEDACQGFGARCRGRAAGTRGDVGVYSFQQSKQLSAGEGGLVVAADPERFARCVRLGDLGAMRARDGSPSWDHEAAMLAENLRMTELQAALVHRQLDDLDATLAAQRRARGRVLAALDEHATARVVWSADPDGDAASHLLLRADDEAMAQRLIAAAADAGVLVRRVWNRVYYAHGVFARAGLTPEQLGVQPARRAEALAATLVSVPTPAELTEAGAAHVARTIGDALPSAAVPA